MCLAVPTRIVSVKGDMAVGEVGGVERDISIVLTPDVKPGDYVIVHAGFAIQTIDQSEARENLDILRQLAAAAAARQRAVRRRRD